MEKMEMLFLCSALKEDTWGGLGIYTEQKYKRNTFVFAPIFHELNSKI